MIIPHTSQLKESGSHDRPSATTELSLSEADIFILDDALSVRIYWTYLSVFCMVLPSTGDTHASRVTT